MSLLQLFFYITFLNWSIVSVLWFFSKKRNRLDYLEIYWPLGIFLLTWSIFFIESIFEDVYFNPRQLIVNILLTIWSLRLFLYLYKRNFWHLGNPKFKFLGNLMGGSFSIKSYIFIFLGLGLIQTIVLIPVINLNFLPGPNKLNFLDLLGVSLFFTGFIIETKSDLVLKEYRSYKGNEFRLLKRGLWKFCRHPNYFGDIVLWWAIYILALNSPGGEWTFFGPLVLTLFFLRISIPYNEKNQLKTRPQYEDYVLTTNKLFPNLTMIKKSLLGGLHYLTPHKFFSFFAGHISKSKNPILKNLLIYIFCFLYKPNLEESERKYLREFISFNDFFTRRIKPEFRPINHSESKVISPVDGLITSYGEVELNNLIQAKSIDYSLKDLLGNDKIEDLFIEGFFITIYLAPYNYHRIHFPMNGIIKRTRYLEGDLYAVNNIARKTIPSLYTRNERALVHVESEGLSYCLVSVGAMMVGSIIPLWLKNKEYSKQEVISAWNEGPPSGSLNIKKGQEMGYFKMGSTVILLLSKKVKLNKNLLSESKTVKFGEELATI